ncbi:threonine/serine exporter family protein [Aerococcaceae bacterium WGS1372]
MEDNKNLVLKTALLAGRIMMESGSEAYRVEDTMQRIAQNSQKLDTESYVTATGIFMSINDESTSQMVQARDRSINLGKIEQTNNYSREYANGNISLIYLFKALQSVDLQIPQFQGTARMIAAGIASCVLMILLGGVYSDALTALIIGSIGYFLSSRIYVVTKMKFINDLIASFAICTLSVVCYRLGIVGNLNSLIIGCLMPLVPGLAITAGMRDLFEGHLLTGIVRIVEAILISTVIGIGIALTLQWFT